MSTASRSKPQTPPPVIGTHEEPLRFLDPDGSLRAGRQSTLTTDELLEGYRWMLFSREFDRRAVSLQRQGRSGTFAPASGQEASIVGSALALDPSEDWIVPQYRDLAAIVRHGYPLANFLLYLMGNPEGAHIPEGVLVLPIQAAIAAQLPHAAGLAWGLKLQQRSGAVLTYFGDGASSEGDFHEACNLAGVVKAPVVFFLQDNGWAISVPRSIQTASPQFANRAAGYGMEGEVVDGNDMLAVHDATRRAVERARDGLGPTLIESRTYRWLSHTTADDNSRYVNAEEHEAQMLMDPIQRLRRHLTQQDILTDEIHEEMAGSVRDMISEAVESAESFAAPHPAQVTEHVFAEMPARLERQRQQLVSFVERGESH